MYGVGAGRWGEEFWTPVPRVVVFWTGGDEGTGEEVGGNGEGDVWERWRDWDLSVDEEGRPWSCSWCGHQGWRGRGCGGGGGPCWSDFVAWRVVRQTGRDDRHNAYPTDLDRCNESDGRSSGENELDEQ